MVAASWILSGNRLLAALPGAEQLRWMRHLEPVELVAGQVLYESGRIPPYAYFPTTAVVSLLCLGEDGTADELAVVGREGVVGVSVFMDGESSLGRAVVQATGAAFRLRARLIQDEFEQSSPAMHLLVHYLLALGAQVSQTALCNRHHGLSQRLCRRLLQGLDRHPNGELEMTHELLAGLLGVRREGVTQEAKKLQDAGWVRYSRGHLFVLDRKGLESHACECYGVVEKEFQRLLPRVAFSPACPPADRLAAACPAA